VPILAESDRTSLNALLYGVPELEAPAEPGWQTQNYAASDLAVLRSGMDNGSMQVVLNYMGYRGGHSHADQLSMLLYGLGMTLAPDAGSIKYRLPEQEGWFKQTLAHNTLVVDRKSQQRANPAQLKSLVAAPRVQMASVASEEIYPGVYLERTLLLNDDYLIDIFTAESAKPHTYDWVYHGVGAFSSGQVEFESPEESPGATNGYQYLRRIKSAAFDHDCRAEWKAAPKRYVGIYMLGEPGTTYYSAQGLIAADVGDQIAEESVPVLIARREMTSTQFVSLIQPYPDGANPIEIADKPLTNEAGQPIPSETARGLQIERAAGTDLLILGNEPGVKLTDGIQFNGLWGWLSQVDGELNWLVMKGVSVSGDGWTVSQEDLGLDEPTEGMGLYLEVAEPGHLFVQNTYGFETYIVLGGFMDSALQITELGQDGNPRRDMPTRKNENGIVKFLAQPGYLYEIVGH
jgi:hypothetical protein